MYSWGRGIRRWRCAKSWPQLGLSMAVFYAPGRRSGGRGGRFLLYDTHRLHIGAAQAAHQARAKGGQRRAPGRRMVEVNNVMEIIRKKKACVGIDAGEKPLQVQGSCEPTIGRAPAPGATIYNCLLSLTETLQGRRGARKTAKKQRRGGAKSGYSRAASAKSQSPLR